MHTIFIVWSHERKNGRERSLRPRVQHAGNKSSIIGTAAGRGEIWVREVIAAVDVEFVQARLCAVRGPISNIPIVGVLWRDFWEAAGKGGRSKEENGAVMHCGGVLEIDLWRSKRELSTGLCLEEYALVYIADPVLVPRFESIIGAQRCFRWVGRT